MNNSEINVGIDTSKDQLDIGILPSNQFFNVPNNHQGIQSAIDQLKLINPDRILIESTGRLELPFAIVAYKAGKDLAYTILPELGSLSRREVASLVGLAPMNKDSGRSRGKRSIRGGRHKVRTVLFVSMFTAIQHHPVLKPTYKRLVAQGKQKKVALIACARKQLITLNAMMKNRTYWNENMA